MTGNTEQTLGTIELVILVFKKDIPAEHQTALALSIDCKFASWKDDLYPLFENIFSSPAKIKMTDQEFSDKAEKYGFHKIEDVWIFDHAVSEYRTDEPERLFKGDFSAIDHY